MGIVPAMAQLTMEQLGWAIGSDIVATLGPVREWFLSELERESSADLPQSIIINSALELPFFAVSHLCQIAQKQLREPQFGHFLRHTIDTVVSLLSELSFESSWKESNYEIHKSKIGKIYHEFLEIRQNYFAKSHNTWRGRLARLIISHEDVDVLFLRPLLAANLRWETHRIQPALIQELSKRVVSQTYEISRRHF